ncbi:MAG: ATP-binding protein [Lachnospiraceae bacterium]|nr:ATP-binding protein [Lachnospiraceae bacterium]MBQ9580219.1 ATP-binding protein [Lachnospiraceae bacterium]MBR0434951.1 ATP-binding protein [Lachnospiraceae bacterium]
MVVDDKRIRIITGYYGSGKTEFAVNYAYKMAREVKRPAIADLDIVNVYFRSREKTKEMEEAGIEVISSSVVEDNCDMPALSSRITVPFLDKSYDYIIDLGGSEVGAKVLGRFGDLIDKNEVDFFMVVNIFRPETGNEDEIIHQMRLLEQMSGFKITGLVNNSNLIHETRVEDILEGDAYLRKVSDLTKIPIRYTTCMVDEVQQYSALIDKVGGEFFPMSYNMRTIWM